MTPEKKILVIEDDPQMRKLLIRMLELDGYAVLAASNGVEGLWTFKNRSPDLVITDMNMPVKGGDDTIRILRLWSPEAKIIAISGADLLPEALASGASVFFAKPFHPAELTECVARCIAEAEAAEQESPIG
jgi:CheY-like chemotaxis protein